MTDEPAQPAEAWLNDPASLESGEPAQPAESAEARAREAILEDIRGRRLLKWLFAEDADTNPVAIGYVDGPIDEATQRECVDKWVSLAFAASTARPTERGAVEDVIVQAVEDAANDDCRPSEAVQRILAALPATDQAAEVERLRKALKPFAVEADEQERVTSFRDGDCVIPRTKITIGQLRRARSALATQPATGGTMGGEDGNDLRPWGWAPGGYVFKCRDCADDLDIDEKLGRLGDKYSWRCEEHAKAARAALQNGGE